MTVCKFCGSEKVAKNGMTKELQKYRCAECRHKFCDNGRSFARMRTPRHVIVTALNLYFGRLSTRKVSKQISEILGEEVSQISIWNWVQKYSEIVSEYVETLQPSLGGKYHHDETEIKVGGEGRYFWETIDEDSRFLVAHLLGKSRTTENAKRVFAQALQKQRPTAFFTDGSFAYDEAMRKVLYTRYKANQVEWVRRVGIRARETNNIIERTHGTLKDRLRVMRGLKHDATAATWLDGYVVYYNFYREHSSIKMTPAQAAGFEVKGWKQLILNAQMWKVKQEVQESRVMEVTVQQ